ncbi:MAG TPA: hypothetical protein VKU89_09580 [Solirubrobacteraceae bacterium]|nr:hypothetical protein [Solirubrobacteraceae bacterium]
MKLFARRRAADRADSARTRPAAIGASWLAWPTLAERSVAVKVAGTNHYRNSAQAIFDRYGDLVMAALTIEARGTYAGAVRVEVAGAVLGHVPHGAADEYRNVVEALAKSTLPCTCRAELEVGDYADVWLHGRPEPRSTDEPFLPPIDSEVAVDLDEGQARSLDESLCSRAKSKTADRLAELRQAGSIWRVVLAGSDIGSLAPGNYDRVVQGRTAGFPLTCWLRIARRPQKPLRVTVAIPRDAPEPASPAHTPTLVVVNGRLMLRDPGHGFSPPADR